VLPPRAGRHPEDVVTGVLVAGLQDALAPGRRRDVVLGVRVGQRGLELEAPCGDSVRRTCRKSNRGRRACTPTPPGCRAACPRRPTGSPPATSSACCLPCVPLPGPCPVLSASC
jgi:hypothetical protein